MSVRRFLAAAFLAQTVALMPIWSLLPFVPDERALLQPIVLGLAQVGVVVVGVAERWVAAAVACSVLLVGCQLGSALLRHPPICSVHATVEGGEVLLRSHCGLGGHSESDGSYHAIVLGLFVGPELRPYSG